MNRRMMMAINATKEQPFFVPNEYDNACWKITTGGNNYFDIEFKNGSYGAGYTHAIPLTVPLRLAVQQGIKITFVGSGTTPRIDVYSSNGGSTDGSRIINQGIAGNTAYSVKNTTSSEAVITHFRFRPRGTSSLSFSFKVVVEQI